MMVFDWDARARSSRAGYSAWEAMISGVPAPIAAR